MKSSKLALFSAITLLFFTTHSHALVLDHAAIDKKAEEIERKVKRDRYIVYGLTGLSFAYQLSVLYHELSKVGATSGANLADTSGAAAIVPAKPINKDFFVVRHLKNMGNSFISAGEYLLCTQSGWIATMQLFLGVGSTQFISKMCENLRHPDTLRWYTRSYAPYQVTIKLMKEQLTTLQDPSVTQEQADISLKLLDLLYDRLVRQAESISAYMTYKTKHFDDEEKIVAQRAKEITLKTHERFLASIAAKMYSHPAVKFEDRDDTFASLIDYAALNTLLDEYKAILRTHSVHFAMIEGETYYDRSVVKGIE